MSMKRNSEDEQGSNPRKRTPNFKTVKSQFFTPWGKKEKDDSIRYFISYTDIYIENANMVGGSHS